MKGIAYILAACLLFLNTGNILEDLLLPEHHTHMECCEDHGSSCCEEHGSSSCDTENSHQDHKMPCSEDHDCGPGCLCSCGWHFVALSHAKMELEGVVVRSFHYANYLNTYSFEYFGDFLQPPRKV